MQNKEGLKTTEVLSPTFNLLYEYDLNNYKIMHYDLYRVKEEKEFVNLGLFSDMQNSIKIIEWPNLIKTPLSDKLEIHMSYGKKNMKEKLNLLARANGKF